MIKPVAFLLFFFLFIFFFTSKSNSTSLSLPQPHASSNVNATQAPSDLQQITQNQRSCSYTVTIKTSCSSTKYTRDQISVSFGDAYGYQVYAPRLDDPSSRAFEKCSTDTYTVTGPCTYQVCYLYVYRSGYDGWKPDYVTVYGYYTNTVTFYYDTWIPGDVWYGFNYCNGVSSASKSVM